MDFAYLLVCWNRLKSIRYAGTRLVELISGIWLLMLVIQTFFTASALSPSMRAIFSNDYKFTLSVVFAVTGAIQIIAPLVCVMGTRRIVALISTFVWIYLATIVLIEVGWIPFFWQSGVLALVMVLASLKRDINHD